MKTKHTPTPWHLSIDEDTNEVIPDIFDGESEDAIHIAHCLSEAGNPTENAKFIVRAVNAHDELVAALEGLLDCTESRPTNYNERVAAKAALAKATGRSNA